MGYCGIFTLRWLADTTKCPAAARKWLQFSINDGLQWLTVAPRRSSIGMHAHTAAPPNTSVIRWLVIRVAHMHSWEPCKPCHGSICRIIRLYSQIRMPYAAAGGHLPHIPYPWQLARALSGILAQSASLGMRKALPKFLDRPQPGT